MEIVELGQKEVRKIYKERMKQDFPSSELKPLRMILWGMRKKVYIPLGLKEDDEILGYAFFMRLNKDYLFDYFAVKALQRNTGIGSAFLKLLRERFADADSVIGEVEDAEYAAKEAEKDLQSRRKQFYLRNGFRECHVKALLFGVPFEIIEMEGRTHHTEQEIIQLYHAHYRAILPKKLYEKNIRTY